MKAFNSLVSFLDSGLDLGLDVDAAMVHFNSNVADEQDQIFTVYVCLADSSDIESSSADDLNCGLM